jgi:hypothetical protein
MFHGYLLIALKDFSTFMSSESSILSKEGSNLLISTVTISVLTRILLQRVSRVALKVLLEMTQKVCKRRQMA